MKASYWVAQLDSFKRSERPEAVLMVAGSTELMRIAVAWSGTRVARKRRLSACTDKDEAAIWQWLWDNVTFARAEFLHSIPGASESTEQKFSALVANRVLFPDGTLNSYVEKYLRERVISLFGLQRTARKRAQDALGSQPLAAGE